jgi:hypothetical protein
MSMLQSALFALDLADSPVGDRHDHVGAIAALRAFVLNIRADFPFG